MTKTKEYYASISKPQRVNHNEPLSLQERSRLLDQERSFHQLQRRRPKATLGMCSCGHLLFDVRLFEVHLKEVLRVRECQLDGVSPWD